MDYLPHVEIRLRISDIPCAVGVTCALTGCAQQEKGPDLKRCLVWRMDSLHTHSRFPVGAANKIRAGSIPCLTNSARIRVTVVVLPVPGPPEIIKMLMLRPSYASLLLMIKIDC